MAPVIIRNVVQVAVQSYGAATLPVMRALTCPAAGLPAARLLDKAGIHQKGGGEIPGVGDLDPARLGVRDLIGGSAH